MLFAADLFRCDRPRQQLDSRVLSAIDAVRPAQIVTAQPSSAGQPDRV